MTTSKENNKTERKKLTLKLKPTSEASDVNSIKSTSTKKGSVEVTIKGRKTPAKTIPKIDKINESDIKKKLALLNNSQESDLSDNIRRKISQNIQESKIKEEFLENKTEEEIEEKIESKADTIDEEAIRQKIKHISKSVNIDDHDVMNKIKNSLAISSKEELERQKVSQERKREQERLEKERIVRQELIRAQEDEKKKSKKKTLFSEKKVNKRKLTYIIGDDDDSFGNRGYNKKKKPKKRVLSQEEKEYKKVSHEVNLPELITVADLSDRMSEKAGDVVKKLFTMGIVATSNQVLDADTAELIIEEFGHTTKRVSNSDVENILTESDDSQFEKKPRAPVVTIMGHVDHGKTSLLDAIRSTKVVDKEHGGITQHIGASRIKTNSGHYITFLDTPGHEAFTEMRSRGANATDIVILVVAADDGVKAQTIEAISHAKAAKVPIIVAINKIDKPGADPSRVKNELLNHNIVSEDMGGDCMFVEVSAKQRLNLDKLEETILLQAEVLELTAPYEGPSSGIVVESRIDPNKGVIASVLVQRGTLDISDLIVVGTSYGKIKKMTDDNGKNIKIATPSVPVEILGLDNAPASGEKFFEVKEEKDARDIILFRERKLRDEKSMLNSVKTVAEIFKDSSQDSIKKLNIIIKADVHGSIEAINGSISKLNSEEATIKIVHQAAGAVNESDVTLASVSNAIIIGFNVRANNVAKVAAENKKVNIRYYSIIYNIVDDIKSLLSGLLDPITSEVYLGKAEIRQVFKVSGLGKIAGSFVTDGIIKRNARVRLLRDDVVVHDGVLKTLKRFKDDVKEVKNNFECGFSIENYDDLKEGDSIECYELKETKREL